MIEETKVLFHKRCIICYERQILIGNRFCLIDSNDCNKIIIFLLEGRCNTVNCEEAQPVQN